MAPTSALWVIEGTGTYGSRLAPEVANAGHPVIEAPRMNARANREKLLLCESGDAIDIALYLDAAVLEHLAERGVVLKTRVEEGS